jgi:hypothetical protein
MKRQEDTAEIEKKRKEAYSSPKLKPSEIKNNESQGGLTEREKYVLRASLYVTLTEEQLERDKDKSSKEKREMTPEEIKDYRERCAKSADEFEKHIQALRLDYGGETLRLMEAARANAIARNEIVEGDEVQIKEKIRAYRGQGIVPIFDWVLSEGLHGYVEQLVPGDEMRPGWWESENTRHLSPPYARVVFPDLYLFYNPTSSRLEVKEISPYDGVNTLGEVVHCKTIEECLDSDLAGSVLDEESVLIDGVVHTVLQEEDCEVLIPTHWLEHKK